MQEDLTDSDKEEWRNLLQKFDDHASKPETTHEDWWPHTEQDVKEFLEDLVEEMGKPEDVPSEGMITTDGCRCTSAWPWRRNALAALHCTVHLNAHA